MSKGLVLILLLVFGSSTLYAQETIREIKREIKKVNQDSKREQSLHSKEAQKAQQFKATSADKLRRVSQQGAIIRAQTDSLKQELSRTQAARKKLKGGAYWFNKKKEDFGVLIAQRVDSIIPLIAKDYPYKIEETIKSLEDLSSQLKRNVISPEEGLGRLWDVLLNRIKMGYTAETYSGYLTINEGSAGIAGKYLRYGAVFALFVSQDGEHVYYLDAGDGENYAWKSAGKDMELRLALKDALKVAEGKTAPRLAALPLKASLLSSYNSDGSKLSETTDSSAVVTPIPKKKVKSKPVKASKPVKTKSAPVTKPVSVTKPTPVANTAPVTKTSVVPEPTTTGAAQ